MPCNLFLYFDGKQIQKLKLIQLYFLSQFLKLRIKLCFSFDIACNCVECDPSHCFIHEGSVKHMYVFEMFEVLNRKKLSRFHKIVIGIFMGSCVDEDNGIRLFWPGNEVNNIKNYLFEAWRLLSSDYNVVCKLPDVVNFGTERGMRKNGDNHFMGGLLQFWIICLLFELPKL